MILKKLVMAAISLVCAFSLNVAHAQTTAPTAATPKLGSRYLQTRLHAETTQQGVRN